MIMVGSNKKFGWIIAAIIVLSGIAVIYCVSFERKVATRWKLETEAKWIGRYLPVNASEADLPSILARIKAEQSLSFAAGGWQPVSSSAGAAQFVDPLYFKPDITNGCVALFYNTNEVNRSLLVVYSSRDAYWMKR